MFNMLLIFNVYFVKGTIKCLYVKINYTYMHKPKKKNNIFDIYVKFNVYFTYNTVLINNNKQKLPCKHMSMEYQTYKRRIRKLDLV